MKLLLATIFTAALLLTNAATAAVVTTIKVTTNLDENGSNAAACSLREALHVVNDKGKAPWGGCPAGGAVGDNVIQLKGETYLLTLGELTVLADVIIAGKDTIVTDGDDEEISDAERDPYTGSAPYRKPPVTIIDAGNASRIINSLGATGSGLTLKDIELRNGRAAYASNQGNGGAIYAALSVALDNTIIRSSKALGLNDAGIFRGGMGGAIFLSKSNANLSLSNATLFGNSAEGTGGAVAMVCDEDLSQAVHSIVVVNSLLGGNESLRGAGAIDVCGSATVGMSASTLSANISDTTLDYGAITYWQTISEQGALTVTNVTAAEHAVGAVFSLKNIKNISLNNSLLVGNDAGHNCILDAATSFPSGNFNTIEDTSCDALLIPSSSAGQGNLHPGTDQFDIELLPLALKGGLTEVYLLRDSSVSALNRGPAGASCSGTDQRGLSRKNGSKCDIGAVERQEPTPVDDDAENRSDSRVVIIDLLANDSFGESESGPNKYADEAVTVVTSDGPVSQPFCKWHNNTDSNEDYRNRLVVDNGGVITPDGVPINCTYKVNVIPHGATSTTGIPSTTAATIKVGVSNISPRAISDVYIRPVGTRSIVLYPLNNDTDADDASPFDAPLNPYPIYISSRPILGHIEGVSGHCSDYDPDSGNEKICYAPTLTYVADNPQSPFADSFQYSVYDDDGRSSTATTVTIKTNAPDPDKGETGGGSLDLVGGLLLALLGLRRARRL
ncbi:MAG: choice-of-anchor Q domain-containing protein [Moraxellaceae bacterium]